ncbi:MAG: pH regulation protein F [Clostridia bacterium]|nr:pH regulation protein F [Clostridia bacterium]
MIEVASYLITVLIAITAIRIIIGPTVWDRLLGFNIVLSKILMLIVLFSMIFDKTYLLDIAITYALIGFVSTLFIARFLKDRGRI